MCSNYRAPRMLICIAVLFGLVLMLVPAASGATIPIACDENELVSAIHAANANSDVDTLELTAGCVYTLTAVDNTDIALGPNGLPIITTDITINGNGSTIARSSAGGIPGFRLFRVDPGGTLTLNDLTLTGASVLGDGGAVHNRGIVNLNHAILLNNRTECDFVQTQFTTGGGIYSTGVLVLQESTLTGNSAASCEPGGYPFGGGIHNAGTMTISGSTFLDNTSNIVNSGSMQITNSTFTDSAAGLVVAEAPTAPIYGRSIHNFGTAEITNMTMAHTFGGYYSVLESSGSLSLRNSIIWVATPGYVCSGTITDAGGNLTWPPDSNACPGKRRDPKLEALADNGGPTQTMALAPGSHALNGAVDANCPATDQRGIMRPQGGHCDIGAFELETPAVPNLLKPADGKKISHAVINLRWETAARVETHRVIVRQDSIQGAKIVHLNVTATNYKTPPLERGHWYYWRIKSCSGVACTASDWRRFRLVNEGEQ